MLKEKVIVITGGAGLLGEEFSRAVLLNNGSVIIADNNLKQAETVRCKLSKEIRQAAIKSIELDITSEDSVQKVIESVSDEFGKIDAWVNNAYANTKILGKDTKRENANSFFDFTPGELNESIALNIGGCFLCCQKIAKYFKEIGKGNIINIASIYGVIAPRFQVYDNTRMTMPVDYAITKSALIHLTRYLAKYLKGSNIRVNSISPGGVYNNQPEAFVNSYNEFSLNKGMLSQKDVSGALIFLLSDMSQYINGQNIIVDDGWTL